MTVIEVIVDKLPESCHKCHFACYNKCYVLDDEFVPYGTPENYRRHDCPLAESVVTLNG